MNAVEFVKEVQSGNIDIEENIYKVIEELKRINKEYNYLNVVSDEFAVQQAKELKKNIKKDKKGKLLGLPVSVKDCICVKGVESRAGSKILSGYYPVFDATVIKKIKEEGGIIIGKTAQDEFGFGSFGLNTGIGFKTPLNPFDKIRVCGGSSAGAAGLTKKANFEHIAIAESTGGSIVNPACFCGVIGFCPTYGLVSRYGLIDYANSLDKIGVMAKSMNDAALMLEIIAGHDDKDSTSMSKPVKSYTDFLKKETKGIKIGIIKEGVCNVDEAVKKSVLNSVKKLEDFGVKTEEVSLPLTKEAGIACYYLIAMSEASTNLAKFCGMRYGLHENLEGGFNKYFSKVRANGFGKEAKRRIILGTFARMAGYRDAYYLKSLKVMTKIVEEYKKTFKRFDLLLSPTMPVLAPRIAEIEKLTPLQNYMMDFLTVGPNLGGFPHVNLPVGSKNGLPIGMMLIADHLQEEKLIQVGSWLE